MLVGDGSSYKPGDEVIHPLRREWGPGVVKEAAPIQHEGKSAQRLVIDFSNHGRVTINTGIATLISKEGSVAMSPLSSGSSSTLSPQRSSASTSTTSASGRGWLDNIDAAQQQTHELWRLSDAMTDPFAGLAARLQATLESFRFGNDPRQGKQLLDWAVGQTGLRDPMTKYSRHELEQGFRRFVRDRDNHLFDLVRSIKRQGRPDVLEQVRAQTRDPLAKSMLERAIRA